MIPEADKTSLEAAVTPAFAGEWTEPTAETVAPGVHRVPVPFPMDGLRAVNVYVIEQPEGVTLIDAGWVLAEAQDRLAAGLGQLGYDLGDVRQCLVTHAHRDHYTLAVALRRLFGFKVAIGIEERPALQLLIERPQDAGPEQVRELIRCGARQLAEQVAGDLTLISAEWDWPDEWLRDAQMIELGDRRLRVVTTPGHTQGHVVFIDDESGLLFSGDHVLPHITPSIGFEFPMPELPLRDYLGSLRLLLQGSDCKLLPAHGPVVESAHTRVHSLLAHHAERLEQAHACTGQTAVTAHDVAVQLRWTRHARSFTELNRFNKTLAIFETAAHLDVLVADGLLTASPHGEARVYVRAAT
jgi:glyoxylase-like metal-dependent hydrolase (beta-lactamase superfamily II)